MDSYSDIELLAELVKRNLQRVTVAPSARQYATPHSDLCIGIGADHTADITMDDDALMELRRLTPNA